MLFSEPMKITEDVVTRRTNLNVENVDSAYSEIRDLLNKKELLSDAHEEKYFNDVDKGQIRAKINGVKKFDKHSTGQFDFYVNIDKEKDELELQLKGKVVTEYPDSPSWKNSLWYYGYRSLFDKFLYGNVREGYKPAVEDKADTLLKRIREAVE